MKKVKKLLLIPLLLCYTSCNSPKITLYLGERFKCENVDVLIELENAFEKEINAEFSSSRFYMKEFYNQLEKDAINLTSSNRINHLLEESDDIIFNIGNYELIRLLDVSQGVYSYSEEVLRTSLEMFEYYLHNSLDIMTDYVNNIIVIPLYNSLVLEKEYEITYNELIAKYNSVIRQNCDEFKVKYVEINSLSKFIYKDNLFSEAGLKYLIKQIKESYESS